MAEKSEHTYDYVCFGDLVYEFDFSDLKEAEKKIKRKLKDYGLGKYDQNRVEYVRSLKNEFYFDQTFDNVAHAKEPQKMQLIYTTK